MTVPLRRGYPRWRRRLHDAAAWLQHRRLKPEDVMVASYPRSGNTWLRFLMYELLTGERPTFETINRMIPNVGGAVPVQRLLRFGGRLYKTHERFRPEYRRAVYMVRDARDVALSEFDFLAGFRGYDGDIEAFLDEFASGEVNPYGSWGAHVSSWLDAVERQLAAVHVVHYEALRTNPVGTLRAVLESLGEEPDDSRLRMAVEHNSIRQMQKDEDRTRVGTSHAVFKRGRAGHRFVRAGTVAGWRTRLTRSQTQHIELTCGESLRRAGYA